ncbi:MAG: hypothetical protein LUQ11_12445 [Methylococcaceae bacterium]|nr:hypothetical protein [Methylococcaceae bacterium]
MNTFESEEFGSRANEPNADAESKSATSKVGDLITRLEVLARGAVLDGQKS